MKIALIGSVSSSWTALDALVEGGVEVCCVLGVDESRSARVGDFRSLRERAERAGIPFLPFLKVREPQVAAFLEQHRPDQLWVIGLSQLVPDEVVRLAPRGAIGFHPTLLPEGRGRAPVAWTILRQARAAVNLFYLVDEADAGDLIAQREVPVLPHDTSEALIERTNRVLREVVLELAPRLRSGDLPRTPQDHSRATHYPKRTPADGLIDWRDSEDWVYRLIRAAGRPYGGAFTHLPDGRRLTIWRATPPPGGAPQRSGLYQPGEIVALDGDLLVAVGSHGEGRLWLTEVELEPGTKPGESLRPGMVLGAASEAPAAAAATEEVV